MVSIVVASWAIERRCPRSSTAAAVGFAQPLVGQDVFARHLKMPQGVLLTNVAIYCRIAQASRRNRAYLPVGK